MKEESEKAKDNVGLAAWCVALYLAAFTAFWMFDWRIGLGWAAWRVAHRIVKTHFED